MKIATVVGARPQFIKAAVVSHEIRKTNQEILIHTGQHYDYNMSDKIFEELEIPKPDYHLGIYGGTHAQMTARMMIKIEEVLQKESPDWILLYGDTNSTLAAALTAAKLHIPICHVEAGVRTGCKTNPEEINRICTDHVSSLLLACTPNSAASLEREGFSESIFLVGDPMYDAFIKYSERVKNIKFTLSGLNEGGGYNLPQEFYYLTCHREENTNNDEALLEIFKAMQMLDAPAIYPVHPRNKERALRIMKNNSFPNLILTEPVGYLESLYMVNHAKKIVTDSGGLQREAFFAHKKCVTILDFVCWPETMIDKRNELSAPVSAEIYKKLNCQQTVDPEYQPFGDGNSSKKIVKAMENYFLCEGEFRS